MPKITNIRSLNVIKTGKDSVSYEVGNLPKGIIDLLGWKKGDQIEFNINLSGELVAKNITPGHKPKDSMVLGLGMMDYKRKCLGNKKYNQLLEDNMDPNIKNIWCGHPTGLKWKSKEGWKELDRREIKRIEKRISWIEEQLLEDKKQPKKIRMRTIDRKRLTEDIEYWEVQKRRYEERINPRLKKKTKRL